MDLPLLQARPLAAAGVLAAVAVLFAGDSARADNHDSCRLVEAELTPSADLQMVVWLEDDAGNYVDTLYITRLTGTYGLGNRPGIRDFNSAWTWPYGRRISTFPVWAHRHGMQWPLVIFQNEDDRNLSHPLAQSSIEGFYCRPLREGETQWDTETCSTTVYTDKGKLSEDMTSRYPPRADLDVTPNVDHEDVAMFESMNPFDSVSRATPPPGELFKIAWSIPNDLPNGNYVAWIEVNKEFDQNEFYEYFAPPGLPWADYGIPYRGQPSIVWRVPIEITETESVASVAEYAGYGDPDGLDGVIRDPDMTITTGVPGSGTGRLLLTDDGGEMYRFRVSARASFDEGMPGAASELQLVDVTPTAATVSFVAPGDDGMTGVVSGYDIRILAGEEITEDNFADAMPVGTALVPDEPGIVQLLDLDELLPSTNYWVAIRAHDECFNYGPIAVTRVTTPERESGTVDACFVATAAYGSVMANDVTMLREFRDSYLRSNVAGELLVEAYYTFGPALAEVVGESETLRRLARAGLAPLVEAVRELP